MTRAAQLSARFGVLGISRARSFVTARVRTVLGGRRGSAQLGLVLTAAAVAGGMTLGSGVADHAARSGYDLAWIGDSTRGQAVQVDPVLGRANVRLQVGKPGDALTLQQGNGQLVVINRSTGRISSIDLGTLLVGGSRAGARGDAVKVLLAGARLYVADLPRGTIQAVDPATEASVGVPWSAGRPLVDVSVDSSHEVWALDSAQHLLDLRWNAGKRSLAPLSTRQVTGAGTGSVLVGHTRGVTLVGARGTILRVGTGHDTSLTAPDVTGPLHGPMSSPDQLVPVADPGSGQVVIVGSSNAVVDNVTPLGCPHPAAPTVFDGKVYVPCSGSHVVLVLDPAGQQTRAPIVVPGNGDPQLTVSGGHLVIDAPGAGSATIIDTSGQSKSFPTVSHGVGVQDPNKTPPAPPAPPSPQPPHRRASDPNTGSGHRSQPGRSGGDVPGAGNGAPATGGAGAPTSGAPSGGSPSGAATATATARPDGSVLVSWVAADPGGSVSIARADTGVQVADVAAGGSSATVTVLDPGTTVAFAVRGQDGAGHVVWTASTGAVTTMTPPGGVTGVTVSATRNGSNATLAVSWSPATGHGGRVSYTVSAQGSSARTTTSATHASLTVPCADGCTGSVTVSASNSAGSGATASGDYSVAASAPAAPPANPPAAPPANPTPTPTPVSTPPPAPPAPTPLPAGGQSAITYTTTRGSDASGNPAVAHLTITNPGDWQGFDGSCALTEDGSPVTEPAVPCSASGLKVDREFYESGTHVYTVTASNAGGSVSSASVSVRVIYTLDTGCNSSRFAAAPDALPPCQPTCPGCQLPFANVPTVGGGTEQQPAVDPYWLSDRASGAALLRSLR